LGIKELPKEAKLGVLIAYKYYLKLLKKIEKAPATALKETRIRVSNPSKIYVLCRSYLGYQIKYV
jgi:phytoene/squalene synthetase